MSAKLFLFHGFNAANSAQKFVALKSNFLGAFVIVFYLPTGIQRYTMQPSKQVDFDLCFNILKLKEELPIETTY